MKRPILAFLCYFCAIQSVFAMKIDRVILSSNASKDYIEFWPIVARLWAKMGVKPTLVLVADETCLVDESLGDVYRFKPVEGVPDGLQAQVIRLLYPALFPNDVCLISDIDMLPLSKKYFINSVEGLSDDAFVLYCDNGYEFNLEGRQGLYPMCYNAAKGRVFSEVFKVSSLEAIKATIRTWYELDLGFSTDEILLKRYLDQFEAQGGKTTRLGLGHFDRLDRRGTFPYFKDIKVSQFVDCHCPRPYSQNRHVLNHVARMAIENMQREP